MYLAVSKTNPNEIHSYTWTEDNRFIINGKEANFEEWEIVEMLVKWEAPPVYAPIPPVRQQAPDTSPKKDEAMPTEKRDPRFNMILIKGLIVVLAFLAFMVVTLNEINNNLSQLRKDIQLKEVPRYEPEPRN